MGDSSERKPKKLYTLILLCFNVLFGLCGVATLILGILLLKDYGRVLIFRLISPGTAIVAQTGSSLLAIGAFGFIAAVLGCSAAARKCSLGWYISSIIVVLVAELALGVSLLVFHDTLNKDMDSIRLVSTLQVSYGSDQTFTQSLDYVQYKFNCCGIESEVDYDRSSWRRDRLGGPDLLYPLTCCPLNERLSDYPAFMNPIPIDRSECQASSYNNRAQRFHEGCIPFVETWFKKQTLTFVGVGVSILLLQITSLAAVFCLCRKRA